MAELKEFMYKKKTGETKGYRLVKVFDTPERLGGISLEGLTAEDEQKIMEIQKQYETALAPYMKNFRNFLKTELVAQ